jgi:phospholipase C
VLPLPACVPDDIPPQDPTGNWQFNSTGLRVPLIAVSPYAKRGYVSHQVTEHTSILRMLEARFGLPALTRRDANAVPPYDLFDFSAANLSVPALPAATVDGDKLSECQLAYPPGGAD